MSRFRSVPECFNASQRTFCEKERENRPKVAKECPTQHFSHGANVRQQHPFSVCTARTMGGVLFQRSSFQGRPEPSSASKLSPCLSSSLCQSPVGGRWGQNEGAQANEVILFFLSPKT